jgi:hypothetical protein
VHTYARAHIIRILCRFVGTGERAADPVTPSRTDKVWAGYMGCSASKVNKGEVEHHHSRPFSSGEEVRGLALDPDAGCAARSDFSARPTPSTGTRVGWSPLYHVRVGCAGLFGPGRRV